ncbi:MAG: bifunctional 4-hydroxy-2-oxoglutarate aldolase/2-dehydro-3-deoxy-phosphogluconate aldolase [Sporichthyaceae bacterium]
MTVDEFAALLSGAVLLPVLRAPDAAAALEQVSRCVDAGLPVVELTTTTPDWLDLLGEVRASWPSLVMGVGTVLEPAQAWAALEAGAGFVVSPCPVPDVRAALAGRLPLLEGGFTPAELLAAAARGVAKFFPAHVGGPDMLRSILALRPGARVVPTGGIAPAHVPAWLGAGALAVGVGAALFDEPNLPALVASLRPR